MLKTQAVGIDLGTTYSCIAHLNEHGEPVTLTNHEGELTTPSVVLIEDGEAIVGTEALRNAIVRPDRVIQNAKRYIGDPKKKWTIDGKTYSPIDVSSIIVRKLLAGAEEKLGRIEQAVITVPAQFSELQRQATVEAGLKAGLKRVDIINEPVAAALCYVLGTEGLWFTELAEEQRILVYDLGGGTFDLSLVRYHKNEVRVIASSGDLNLGGLDFNEVLQNAIAGQFVKEFKVDPRQDPQSAQFLALEVENAKRALSVRAKAALTVQHDGHRKTYQVEQAQFERLTQGLVDRTCEITQKMLKDNKLGWAKVDVILTAGGSSRMPMVRNALKKIGGRTLNTSLSPDLSIAHGATYYAGMLLTNSDFAKSILNEAASARLAKIKQQSVTARGLGILVRNESGQREPHFLIPANTPLPASFEQTFGTVIPNQKRVHLHIVESGTDADQKYVELGTCIIDNLPPKLPENSQVSVTISYDDQARVHVSAKDVTSGKVATTEIVREENLVTKDVAGMTSGEAVSWQSQELKLKSQTPAVKPPSTTHDKPLIAPKAKASPAPVFDALDTLEKAGFTQKRNDADLEDSGLPIPLCNECGETLDSKGRCQVCDANRPSNKMPPNTGSPAPKVAVKPGAAKPVAVKPVATNPSGAKPGMVQTPQVRPSVPVRPTGSPSGILVSGKKPGPANAPKVPLDIEDIIDLELAEERKKSATRPATSASQPSAGSRPQVKPVATSKPGTEKPKTPTVKAPPLPPSMGSSGKKPSIRKGSLSSDTGEVDFFDLDK